MRANTILTVLLAVAMVTSLAVAGTAAQSTQSSAQSEANASAHAGTHVAFETAETAIVDYRVDGAGVIATLEVESASEAEQRTGPGLDVALIAAADVEGSALSPSTTSETRVAMATESGATVEAHDGTNGQLVVDANGEEQLVGVTIESDANAERADDRRVVVTHEDGTQGAFILVGEGEVDVDEAGDVSAHLEGDSVLTYRQYDDRDAVDDDHERLIADGVAAAEVYLSTDGDGEAVADVVSYAEDTSVEVVTHSENEIRVTAERAESEGRIVIVSLAETAFDAAGDVTVSVDGEAATHVESASELEAAAAGGEEPAYALRQGSTAAASTEVVVALNHFSERDVTIASQDDETETPADENWNDIVEENPGFGALIAGIALAFIALLAARLR